MDQRDRRQLFDDWAAHYDRSVRRDDKFPFDGYEQVLDAIVQAADVRCGMKVLDLAIGTGNLAARFAELGCNIWGVDFSSTMLARAAGKVPRAVLVQASLTDPWPAELQHRFDRIVSAYALHELDLDSKIRLVRGLAECHLAPDGWMVIGDIAFSTSESREKAHQQLVGSWDDDEFYWAADEMIQACKGTGLRIIYRQISSCGGVFVVESSSSQ